MNLLFQLPRSDLRVLNLELSNLVSLHLGKVVESMAALWDYKAMT